MKFLIYLVAWFALAFICGSIPFGWIVTRIKGIDIRAIGSGNIGGTNVWRALGWQYGMLVLLLDTLKGLVPVLALLACLANMPEGDIPAGWEAPLKMLVAIAAVLGHTFTPWLKFKGGKGIATGLGVTLGLYQWWMIPILFLFALVLATTRYVSLGSIMAALLMAALSFSVPEIRPLWPFGLLACLLVLWTHRSNIDRLMAGTENRVGDKKQDSVPEDPPPESDE